MVSKHSHNFECQECHKHWPSRSTLNAHMKGHSSEKPYACDQCDKRFSIKIDFTMHLETNHQCTECEYKCQSNEDLKKHKKDNHDESCSKCKKLADLKRKLSEIEKEITEIMHHNC